MPHFATDESLQPEQRPPQLVHAAVRKAAYAQYLALVQLHREARQTPDGAQVVDLHDHLVAVDRVEIGSVVVAFYLATDHELLDLGLAEFPAVDVVYQIAVPEHGHRVARLHDLLEIVRDEEHRLVLSLQLLDELVDDGPAALRERRGGLVEDEQLGLADHHPRHLHQLSVLEVE